MTRLFVLFVFVFGFFVLFAAPANAVAPIMQFKHKSSTKVTAWYNTRDELCTAWTAWATGDAGRPYECVPPQTANTYFRYRSWNTTTGTWNSTSTQEMTTRMWCADGSTPDTSKPLDQQCGDPPPPSCEAGVKGSGTWYHSTGPESSNIGNPDSPAVTGGCVSSCKVSMYDIEKCYLSTDGKNYCTYKYSTTGATCSVGTGAGSTGPQSPVPPLAKREDVPPFSPPSGKCPTGSVQGGVSADGVPICIGTGSDPKNAPAPQPKTETEKTEATPDGGSKTTQTTTTNNADGSTTTVTTTTTTAPDGSKTTTVSKDTTAAASGGAGKDDSAQEDEKYDLCKQNPMLNICRNSSVSGSCGQVTCQGDAIQCATLRAAAAMECKQRADEDAIKASAEYGLGSAAVAGNDPQAGSLPGPSKATLVEVGALNKDGWLGDGAAFDDLTVTVQGQAIVIPFSEATGLLVGLRYALMIAAALVSFRILSGAILRT